MIMMHINVHIPSSLLPPHRLISQHRQTVLMLCRHKLLLSHIDIHRRASTRKVRSFKLCHLLCVHVSLGVVVWAVLLVSHCHRLGRWDWTIVNWAIQVGSRLSIGQRFSRVNRVQGHWLFIILNAPLPCRRRRFYSPITVDSIKTLSLSCFKLKCIDSIACPELIWTDWTHWRLGL